MPEISVGLPATGTQLLNIFEALFLKRNGDEVEGMPCKTLLWLVVVQVILIAAEKM
jgi:hypothetical protein